MSSEADLKALFDKWDLDGNGTVRLNEITKWMEDNKGKTHQEAIDLLASIWPSMDLDGDQKLTWDEFKTAMSKC